MLVMAYLSVSRRALDGSGAIENGAIPGIGIPRSIALKLYVLPFGYVLALAYRTRCPVYFTVIDLLAGNFSQQAVNIPDPICCFYRENFFWREFFFFLRPQNT